jgi:hypothetical protein
LPLFLTAGRACPELVEGMPAGRKAGTARAIWINPQTGDPSGAGEFPTIEKPLFSTPKDWPDAFLLKNRDSEHQEDQILVYGGQSPFFIWSTASPSKGARKVRFDPPSML